MEPNHHSSSHYIYEVDNIPNFESRRYGCCKRLIALRAFSRPIHASHTTKKPH